jgi:hypothetical protein
VHPPPASDVVSPGTAACSREDELALLLVGTAARRRATADRIAVLSAEVDDRRLFGTLARQRVLLLGGERRIEAAPDTVSDWFRERLEQARAASRVRAMAFSAVTHRVTGRLEELAIPAVALKGAGLSEELYGDAAMRHYDDIDVLVPADALTRAVSEAHAMGWVAAHRSPLHDPPVHPGGAPPLELHWRIHWYEAAFASELIGRSQVVDGRRQLETLDQFAALLLYYARDGFAGLRLVADIAAWWDRHGSADAVRMLVARIPDGQPLAAAWRTALGVATRVAGLGLAAPEARSRRETLARRLVNWDRRGDPDQVMANVTLVDGLLAPAGGLGAFLGRLHAVAGVARTAARYLLALWHLRGGRVWSPLPRSAEAGTGAR